MHRILKLEHIVYDYIGSVIISVVLVKEIMLSYKSMQSDTTESLYCLEVDTT